jgi:hypothetical protein
VVMVKYTLSILLGAVGFWSGCANQYRYENPETLPKDGLVLQITVPSTDVRPDGTVSAFLILTNGGSDSIRTTAACTPLSAVGPPSRIDVTWFPGWYSLNTPSNETLVHSVQTLKPGDSIRIPFDLIVGTNKSLYITAHYDSRYPWSRKLDLWYGYIVAEPAKVRFIK